MKKRVINHDDNKTYHIVTYGCPNVIVNRRA